MCGLKKVAVGSLGHREKACGAGSKEFSLSPPCAHCMFSSVCLCGVTCVLGGWHAQGPNCTAQASSGFCNRLHMLAEASADLKKPCPPS